jgi:HD superfamily phosphohydrolase
MKNEYASWLPTDDDLRPFYDGVSKFVGHNLAPIQGRSKTELSSITAKSVLDPLIGYIHLRHWETAFLETRLLQRLRRIRQLGLAHLVYPTLGYSRFEHSLGVLGRLSQILTRLIQVHSSDKTRNPEIIDLIRQYEIPLRLAALFHDAGHCIFSHVSERAFANLPGHRRYPSTERICQAVSETLRAKKLLAPAEVLSISIISCPLVRELASRLDIPEKTEEHINLWFEQAARFVAGTPVNDDPKTVFLAQLISSGLDADKLDYMTREAFFSGIPLGMDLTRILDKIRVFRCKPEQLPSDLHYLKQRLPGAEYYVLGLAHGAQFAFEEFCIARVPLYDKIYLHQKIRAAEAQLHALLIELPQVIKSFNELHRWLSLKESMIEHEELPIPEQDELGDLFSAQIIRVERLKLDVVRDRVLLQRAFALGLRNSLSEAPRTVRSPTLAFIEAIRDSHTDLIQAIRVEVGNILDVPDHRRVQQGALSIYIKQPVTLPQRWALPIDQITVYYAQSRALSYVFAPREICHLVSLASERAIWDLYRLQFEQADFLADMIVDRAKKVKKDLMAKGYYDNAVALKLASDFFYTAAAQEQIQKVVSNLSEFTSFKGEKITPATVTSFIMQFPERLQPAALELATKFHIITPKSIAQEIVDIFKSVKNVGAKNILIVPLGNLTDSATHLLYEFKNHPDEEIRAIVPRISQLTDFSLKDVDQLIVFDDNTNTSAQAVNIFCQWLDIPIPEKWDLKELHVYPLRDQSRKALREMPVTFVFGVGPEKAEDNLKEALEEVCKMNRGRIAVRLHQRLKDDEKVLSGKDSKFETSKKLIGELREMLSSVGKELMLNEKKDPSRALSRALGENGTEATVLFPYNVPTMTITAFWCAGVYNGQPWMPLVERRRNRRADGELAGEDA